MTIQVLTFAPSRPLLPVAPLAPRGPWVQKRI